MKYSEGQVEETRPDEELVKSYLAGDAEAFNVLYERYRKQIYGYLNKLLPERHEVVEDLFQQTWIKAINQFGRYERKRQFISWLLCIAHNLAMDHYRSMKSAGESASVEELDEMLFKESGEPWRDMDGAELGSALDSALEQLSPELKEVFLMRQEDVPFKEIAEMQECSINTALSRMQYALKGLRKALCGWHSMKGNPK